MTQFVVKINQRPSASFTGFLYNKPAHLAFQEVPESYTFDLVSLADNLSYARYHLVMQEEEALSSFKAPFGSIEFSEKLSAENLEYFLDTTEPFCRDRGIKKIRITSYPFCYHEQNSSLLMNLLLRKGYFITTADLNFHLPMAQDRFESGLHHSAHRRLKKCMSSGFTFQREGPERLSEFYQLYMQCRQFKGIPVNMGEEKLAAYFSAFPESYFLFSVRDEGQMVAAGVCLAPAPHLLYNFLPADLPQYRSYSPMILLLKGIFDYCRKGHFQLFDLGTASRSGAPLTSLVRFKQNLGGVLTIKPSFEKHLI